jgi:hypothetical protein
VAVKQVRVSDLSGRQATEEQFAKLIVHEHPKYQGPIILATGPNPATPNHSQGKLDYTAGQPVEQVRAIP